MQQVGASALQQAEDSPTQPPVSFLISDEDRESVPLRCLSHVARALGQGLGQIGTTQTLESRITKCIAKKPADQHFGAETLLRTSYRSPLSANSETKNVSPDKAETRSCHISLACAFRRGSIETSLFRCGRCHTARLNNMSGVSKHCTRPYGLHTNIPQAFCRHGGI